MFVDKIKILLGSLGSGTTINIPLKTNFFPVDNAELIEDKFVKDEVEKSINPIVDYKKIIFKPARINSGGEWEIIDKFKTAQKQREAQKQSLDGRLKTIENNLQKLMNHLGVK